MKQKMKINYYIHKSLTWFTTNTEHSQVPLNIFGENSLNNAEYLDR